MNTIVRIFFAFCIASFFIGGYIFYSHKKPTFKSGKKEIKIALCLPMSHPSLEAISRGFQDSLEKHHDYSFSFKIYNGNANRTLMLAQAQEALNGSYDLLVPIATAPALMLQELSVRKKHYTPIVALAADINPQPEVCPHITGVTDTVPLEQQRDALLRLKPSTKNVAVVYNASEPRLEKIAQELSDLFSHKNVTIAPLAMYQLQDLHTKVPALLNQGAQEVIIVLKDNLVVSGIDALVKYCMQNKQLLFVSDLDSVERGAALGFGVHEYDIGSAGGELAYRLLTEKISPADIPIQRINTFKIKINKGTMQQQGLVVDTATLDLMEKKGEVYDPKEFR